MPNVLITGGTGLIGTQLSHLLEESGFTVRHLSRKENLNARFPAYHWDPAKGTINLNAFENVSMIVTLAGAGIADKHWTKARKKLLIDSRVNGNNLITKTLLQLKIKPKVIVAASAVGYYGDRKDEILTENSQPGKGFLTECTMAWEATFDQFEKLADRFVALRIGIVLSSKGGALEKLALPFKAGIGNYFGKGDQYYSWIHIDDICEMFAYALKNEKLAGYFNAVGPRPATTKEIIYSIKEAKNSSALVFPSPSFAMKLALGEMSCMILGSTRVSAQKILNSGYQFQHDQLVLALSDIFERNI